MTEKIKLFCLPYAGGSSITYKKWSEFLPKSIVVFPIDLAGKGERAGEELYKNVDDAIADIYNIIINEISNDAYAIFGHSLGAILAYEVVQKIKISNKRTPIHTFFSSRRAPHLNPKTEKKYHQMSDELFCKEIQSLGGTPIEFFQHPELIEYILPVLKNDFKLSETVVRNPLITPLDCSITVFMGKDEPSLEAEDVHGWMLHTKDICNVHYLNGGHFFINNETQKILRIINTTLNPVKILSHYNSIT